MIVELLCEFCTIMTGESKSFKIIIFFLFYLKMMKLLKRFKRKLTTSFLLINIIFLID